MRPLLIVTILALTACSVGETSDQLNSPSTTSAADAPMELVEHVCSEECQGSEHEYAHGEKGHECTPQCKYMREKRK